jgi:hypothetical protein
VGVADAATGAAAFRRLGFAVELCGAGAFAFLERDVVELSPAEGVAGLRRLVLGSDDLAADVAAMRGRGVDVAEPVDRGLTIAGTRLEWREAAVRNAPLALAEWVGERPRSGSHPNAAVRLERAYVVVDDLAEASRVYGGVLGMPPPPIERGTVIIADMAVFQVGRTGLTIARPAGEGPAAEALRRQGPAPFQVLYRTTSMDAAAGWMAAQALPPPTRGTRNTGEDALLVRPEHACGVYVGLVGPA